MKNIKIVSCIILLSLLAGCAILSALSNVQTSVSVPTKNGTVTVSSGDTTGTLTVAYQKNGSDGITTLTLNTETNSVGVESNALTSNTMATTVTLTGGAK